jgi:cytochrome P450
MATKPISFVDPDVQRCPFEAYAKVHEHGPVYYDPTCDMYIVVGYDEIRRAAVDASLFSSITGKLLVKNAPYQAKVDAIYRENGFQPINTLVVADPPLHTFHRRLVDKLFTPVKVRRMEEYLQSIIDEMIEEFIDRGEVEFFSEMAMKVPTYVIADQLGFPRKDFGIFKRWSDAVIQEGDPNNGEERQIELTRTICELQQYIARAAAGYREKPADCLLSDLVRAEDNGRRLSTVEIVSMVLQILVAGNDTTTSAMTSTMLKLVQTPGLEDQLREHPEKLANFVEEVLRLESPIQGLYRRATRDTKIGDEPIPEGSTIVLRFGAGNRDPREFPCPDQMDIGRKNARANLTFGSGVHYCVGNQLARGEIRLTFATLLKRLRNFRLARGEAGTSRLSHFFGYGLIRLKIAFDKI